MTLLERLKLADACASYGDTQAALRHLRSAEDLLGPVGTPPGGEAPENVTIAEWLAIARRGLQPGSREVCPPSLAIRTAALLVASRAALDSALRDALW